MKNHWGWIMSAGFAYLILGLLALSQPIVTTIGMTYAIASLLIAVGLVELVQAIRLYGHPGNVTRIFQMILSIVCGGLIFRYPEGGLLSIALVLSFYFFVSATSQWMIAFSVRPHSGWFWGIVGSITSFILGVYIILGFPLSALWLPGFLLAINFIIGGASLIAFAWSLHASKDPSSAGPKNLRPRAI